MKTEEYPLIVPAKPWAEWNAKAKFRAVHNRYADKLKPLLLGYQEKINRLYAAYREKRQELLDTIPGLDPKLLDGVPELMILLAKIKRLEDKYYTVKQEIAGRDLGIFKRGELYGTTYYWDFVGGLDTNDGLGTGTAWKTFAKYSEVTIRTAGDILKMRANVTGILAAIVNFDEDGTANAPIEAHGCSIADDPWGDGSNVKPTMDFNAGNFYLNAKEDDFWIIKRIIIKNSSSLYLALLNNSQRWKWLACEARDGSGSTGFYLALRSFGHIFEDCIIENNQIYNILIETGSALLINCDINSGALVTNYGVYCTEGRAELVNCRLGQSVAHGITDIYARYGSQIHLRNTLYNTSQVETSSLGASSVIYSEDDKSVFGAHLVTYGYSVGKVTKDTAVVRPGGALSSAKMEPGANCGLYAPLTLNNESLIDSAFKVWLPGGAAKTITLYIRSLGAWAAYPTASQLYIEASYLSNAATAARTAIASTAVLADGTTWVPFTVTFTPAREGWAYVNLYLKKYEAAKGCYVDIKPV